MLPCLLVLQKLAKVTLLTYLKSEALVFVLLYKAFSDYLSTIMRTVYLSPWTRFLIVALNVFVFEDLLAELVWAIQVSLVKNVGYQSA